MMARLRAVRGVTRVSLQSSTKTAEATESVVDAAAGEAVTGCDVTGGKTPPDFTVVVFFEDAPRPLPPRRRPPPRPPRPARPPRAGSTETPTATTAGLRRRRGHDRLDHHGWCQVTKNRTALLGVVVALAAVAAYWFLLLAPKREEAAALAAKVEQTQAAVAQAESTLASYRQAQAAYKSLSATVARLGKAVPADDDVRSLVVQLESAATASKVDFRSIDVGSGSSAAATDATAAAATVAGPPGSTPMGSAGFSSMAVQPAVQGQLPAPRRAVRAARAASSSCTGDRIDVTGRLLRVEGLTMSPNGGDYRHLNATVNASTYLVPATEPLSLDAASAAGTTPSTTPPADGGTTPPVTTATTTGALR